jgi:trehalose 2-sulfotransferase
MSIWDDFGRQYDFPLFEGKPCVYLIASLPRSGSHYFAHVLRAAGQFGCPNEYLHPTLADRPIREVLGELFKHRTSPNGWFGLKAHWPQFVRLLRDPVAYEFVDIERYIRITRRDVLGAAISYVIARQTSSWISFQPTRGQPSYDFVEIADTRAKIEEQDRQWTAFFEASALDSARVVYEDLLASPQATIDAIAKDFGVAATKLPAAVRPQRQAGSLNNEWRQRFLEDASRHE